MRTGGPDDDWYLRVQPPTRPADLRHLLRGEEVRAWVGKEIERLQGSAVLADGGVLAAEFIREIPPAHREELLAEVFLEPCPFLCDRL